jgi:exonuclease SbcC
MIPLKLSIQNFLSYGPTPQVIDFTRYRLICLSGKNGHGKSALLDAITWALWGQARKVNAQVKPDQGLLRLGQTDMVVCLDFIFNGQGYRVRRMYSTKYGKPSAHVDFGTYDGETDSYASLTEKTIRKTQEKIEQMIGLDYEAFINSSFLRQGQANEFSKKLPKERKDVLANILGLNRYEKAKKLAAEKIRTLSQEKEKLAKISEHLALETEQLAPVKEKLHETTLRITALAQQEQEISEEKKSLEASRTSLFKKQSDFKLIDFEYQQAIKQREAQERTFRAYVSDWKKTHAQQLRLPDRKKIETEKAVLSKELAECHTAYQELLEHKEKLLSIRAEEQECTNRLQLHNEHQLQEKKFAIERLNTELTNVSKAQIEIETTITAVTYEQNACQKNIETLQKMADPTLLINDTAALEKQFERQKSFYLKWVQEGKRATHEQQNLHHKQLLTHDAENPSCPLCEQNLSLARKRFLAKKFEQQELFLAHRITRLKKVLQQLKEHIEKQKQAISLSKQTDELLKKHTAFTTTLAEHAKTALTLAEEYACLEKKLKDAHKTLAEGQSYALKALNENKEYQTIKKEQLVHEEFLKKNATIPAHLKALTEKQILLEHQLQQWNTYDEQRALQEDRKKTTHALAQRIRTMQAEEKQLAQRLEVFATLQTEEKTAAERELTHAQKTHALTQEKGTLLLEKGKLEAELAKLDQQVTQHKQFDEQSKKIQHELTDYEFLAKAFGKDGIQALLIEDALPEIEQEANDLLSRLTDNQAHIFIESLRDLKKGGVKETLDINISDNSGLRPYEMFSGGEAFRIDFSLRIAISKLLARRAGTSLQTLIIDEGFGSQDEEGLGRIMDAIYKIQGDFEKIIIVSHLATMKDQFPVHFLIEKGPHGSHAFVREQG